MQGRRLTGRAWAETRQRVFARDGYVCQIAGPKCTRWADEVDHIRPIKSGGGNHLSNLRAACRACNRGRYVHDNYGWTGVDFL